MAGLMTAGEGRFGFGQIRFGGFIGGLEEDEGCGDDDSGDEEGCDESSVAAVTVGHIEAGDR
jgi:hypothetical protein